MEVQSIGSQHSRPGLDQILELQEEGVTVANSDGSALQKVTVIAALVYGLFAVYTIGRSELLVFLILPAVILAIDFLSGLVHWFFDTQVQPSGKFLGRIAIDFLDHHLRPRRTVDVGFFVSAWRPAVMVSLPLLTLALLLERGILISAVLLWIGFLSMFVPQTHKLAHRPDCGRLAMVLQSSRVMLHPVSHHKHHTDNAHSFCVFTGWLNPLLDRTAFWRSMESLFATIRGH